MNVLAFVFFAAMLALELYQAYGLWSDPKGSWKKYTARRARIRSKTRGTLLSIFDIDPYGFENNSERYVFWNRLLISLFILLTLFMMSVAAFVPAR